MFPATVTRIRGPQAGAGSDGEDPLERRSPGQHSSPTKEASSMIEVSRITLREIEMSLVEPFRISSGVTTTRRILLLEVETADGLSTWSECVAGGRPNYSPETIDTAWLAIRAWLAPRVLGRSIGSPEEASVLLGEDIRGHQMARACLEMAYWALEAERQQKPLAELLGGTRELIEVGVSIGIQDSPAALVEKARAALQAGYRKIKIKIKPGKDFEYLSAVREALGPSAPLMADANNAYSLSDIEHLARLDELHLVMIEQPLAWDDVIRHARVQRRLETPVCLDESITGLDQAEDMIEYGAGKIINIKPGRVAGLTTSKAIHDLCEEHDIPVWCGGMLESGVGRAYNVALASLPNFTIPGDVSPSSRYWKRDVVSPEWTMDESGRIRVPTATGLGVEVDKQRIEELSVRSEVIE